MSTIESNIMAALFTRLQALVLNPAMPIAWPNVSYTPPATQKYLRVGYVPNVANRMTIGSDGPHQHLGLMQVSVYWPKSSGEAGPREVAGQVAAWFPCDLKLYAGGTMVRITKRPDVRDMIIEDAAVQIPVMIDWEVYA